MAFTNFNSSGKADPNASTPPNSGGNGSNSSNSGSNSGNMFQSPYQGGGQPIDDIKEKLINYNEKFKSATPILYRDKVIQQSLTAANRKTKPNLMLFGSPGVGKTQIVEEIARMIETGSQLVPKSLRGKTIYELPLVNITANTMYRGQMEENIKQVIEFFANPKNKAILFIDEIHSLFKYDEISQTLKPALARGDIRLIGATTMTEYQTVMNDPAFSRRMTPIIVDQLSVSQTTEILKNIYPKYESHYDHTVEIPDELFEQIVYAADRNRIQSSYRPDNAITLMDHVMSAMVQDRLIREDYARQTNNQALLQAFLSSPKEIITSKFLNKTAEKLRTGNSEIDDDPQAFAQSLTHIKGQDHITQEVIDLTNRSRLNLNLFSETKPLSFFFIGPSGVGKTEISKLMAKFLTGDSPITVNMTEYSSPASINRLIGSPIGYVGSDSKQELPFDTLRTNPRRLILLDEFEKGDKSIQRLFMSAIDEGHIKDNRGNIIDFSQTIIIATTNAGQTNDKTIKIGFTSKDNESNNQLDINNLENYFDRELINRFKYKLQFKELTQDIYIDILKDQYQVAYEEVTTKYPQYTFNPDLDDQTIEAMVKETYDPKNGARPIREWIRTNIEDQMLAQI